MAKKTITISESELKEIISMVDDVQCSLETIDLEQLNISDFKMLQYTKFVVNDITNNLNKISNQRFERRV